MFCNRRFAIGNLRNSTSFTMGSALRRAKTNFNIESRAHRLIDKDKLPRAPLHPTTIKKMKEIEKGAGNSLNEAREKLHRKDSRLLGMLQDLKVDSMEPAPKAPDGSKQLPQDRRKIPEPASELDSQNAPLVPPGRLSVYMVQELLARHKQDPKEYNADRISKDYQLDLKDTKNILEYFKTLKVVPLVSEEEIKRLEKEKADEVIRERIEGPLMSTKS